MGRAPWIARRQVTGLTRATPIVAAASQVPVVLFPARRFQLHSAVVETSIELGYAGVVIGRVTVSGNIDESGLFVPVPDPLPVGTRLNVKIDGRAAEARVISVLESAEPGKAGMRVRIGAAGGESAAAGGESAAAGAESPAPSGDAVPEAADAQADETAGNSGAVGGGGGGGGRRRRRRR